MWRLRFFRILLPATLILFVVLLALAYRQRPPVHLPPGRDTDTARSAEQVEHITYTGDERTLEFVADKVEESTAGDVYLEAVRRLVLPREDRGPLIVSADRGEIAGEEGVRMMHFESGVVIRDPEAGLALSIPVLEVDEQAGKARSLGEVRVEGPNLEGRAASLVYDLADRPSELLEIELHNAEGASLTAQKVVLYDGLDDVELIGEVEALRFADEYFRCGRLRVYRGPGGRMERMHAVEQVDGSVSMPGGGLLGLQSREAEVLWGEDGEISRLELDGEAELRQGASSLAAANIIASRSDANSQNWAVEAVGTVYLQGLVLEGPAWLRAERLNGLFDSGFRLRSARVDGEVRFDGPQTRAESDRLELTALDDRMEIRLESSGTRKARLARETTRVAAESIVTDERGEGLLAEGAVEATLLPVGDSGVPGPFNADSAVHFVAARLEGQGAAQLLVFSGNVRAWQGEQNLSAQSVTLDQSRKTLTAVGNVTTRVPRTPGDAVATEADFIQINAARLDYDDPGRQAVFEGDVRVRLDEGWLEAERMEVDFLQGQSGIREIRAEGRIGIEFRDPATEGRPMVIAGHSDRLVYRPGESSVWLYGDAAPAAVRRIGKGEGTTSGRVLRYHLGDGSLEVESGGRIQTAGD